MERAFCSVFFFLPISKALFYLSFIVALLLLTIEGRFKNVSFSKVALYVVVVPSLILCFLPLFSLLVHDDIHQGLMYLNLCYYWLIALVIFVASTQMSIRPWVRAFVCGIFLVFCYAQISQFGWIPFNLVPSGLSNSIMYSQFLSIGLIILSILYKHENSRTTKCVYLAVMALFFFGLLSGVGRTGLLTTLIFFPYILSNVFGKVRYRVILVGCLIGVVVMLMSPKVQQRVGSAFQDIELYSANVTQTSLGYRFEMWRTSLEIFRDHPLIGAGAYGFKTAWHKQTLSKEENGFVEPHNAYVFFASSYGLFGLLSLLWLYAGMFLTGWRQRRSFEGSIVIVFAVTCILASLTNTMFIGATSLSWVMMFIGLQGSILKVPHAANMLSNRGGSL